VIPHPEHVRNAAGFERAPDLRRPGDAFEQTGVVNRAEQLKSLGFQELSSLYPRLNLTKRQEAPKNSELSRTTMALHSTANLIQTCAARKSCHRPGPLTSNAAKTA
jgi:hypothetical protein